MAEKEKLFEGPIDRTPYGGCIWVAVCVAAFVIIGGELLWNMSGYFKSHHMLQISLPKVPAGDNVVQQIKDTTKGSIPNTDAIKKQAEQQAQDAIRQEAENQINKQVDNAKSQISQ